MASLRPTIPSPPRRTPYGATRRRVRRVLRYGLLAGLLLVPVSGCRMEAGTGGEAGAGEVAGAADADAGGDRGLAATLARAGALADSVEERLRPVPLMRPVEEQALKRYSNAENVARARELGVRPADSAALAALVSEGRLVRLEDSTEHWVIRELRASTPYVTPDVRTLLGRLGRSFQARLREMGLPAYRLEISSVLRTPASQAALRRRNVNAAAGTSSHEFGTTLDIAYSGYAAPAELPPGLSPASDPRLDAVARVVLERVAARKSRELKAVLGEVLREAQDEGAVLVTLEELQPVYHLTVARRLE